MTTYVFKVVIEPDIDEVVHMIVAELIEDGEPIPEDVKVSPEPLVSVTV